MKKILLTIFVLLFYTSAYSATYYVANGGDDSDAGSDVAPWAHCPGFDGWTGSATLSANDTVYFDSADTFTCDGGTSCLEVEGGVSYIGDTWGAGTRAKLDVTGGYSRATVMIDDDDATYDTVFQGFEVDVNSNGARGIMINDGDHNGSPGLNGQTKLIKNNYVHDVGTGGTYYYGIICSVNVNSQVDDLEIVDNVLEDIWASGIAVYAGYNVDNADISNVLVSGNDVQDSGLNMSGPNLLIKNHVDTITVEYNYFHDNTGDKPGIIIEHVNFGNNDSPENVIIRYNKIEGHVGPGIYTHGESVSNVDIYGNIIYGNAKPGISFESNLAASNVYKIYNNTLYDNGGAGDIAIASGAGVFTTLEVKNNICYLGGISDTTSRITASATNLETDPDFTSVVAGSEDFTLQVGSSAIDNGTNVGATYGNSLDPSSSWTDSVALLDQYSNGDGWEIGAFVYEGAAPIPAASSIIGGSGSGTLGSGSGTIAATP